MEALIAALTLAARWPVIVMCLHAVVLLHDAIHISKFVRTGNVKDIPYLCRFVVVAWEVILWTRWAFWPGVACYGGLVAAHGKWDNWVALCLMVFYGFSTLPDDDGRWKRLRKRARDAVRRVGARLKVVPLPAGSPS